MLGSISVKFTGIHLFQFQQRNSFLSLPILHLNCFIPVVDEAMVLAMGTWPGKLTRLSPVQMFLEELAECVSKPLIYHLP